MNSHTVGFFPQTQKLEQQTRPLNDCLLLYLFLLKNLFRIQEQLRRIKRNQEKEKLQPVKKKKEKPPNNVSLHKMSFTV